MRHWISIIHSLNGFCFEYILIRFVWIGYPCILKLGFFLSCHYNSRRRYIVIIHLSKTYHYNSFSTRFLLFSTSFECPVPPLADVSFSFSFICFRAMDGARVDADLGLRTTRRRAGRLYGTTATAALGTSLSGAPKRRRRLRSWQSGRSGRPHPGHLPSATSCAT